MKITIVGPAHPYRGGLASIMETMAREFQQRGDEVNIKTFTVQYPKLLFPGKSQTLDTTPPEDLNITRCVNTMNPFNWIKIGRQIKRECPDFVLLKYWTPFMAPCFGTIARIARRNKHTKFICQIDNVEPHEHHMIDYPCNLYFLRAVDGYVYMSEQVNRELKEYTQNPAIFSPHPMFENFGSRVERNEACETLKLDPAHRYAMFFGLIRDYKGLDILLEAWAKLKAEGKTEGRKLVVAGEFYSSKDRYLAQIKSDKIEEDVIIHEGFVSDEMVKHYFSATDFVILPYHTASQSGVTQIAYNFSLPMIVTNVGGLPEIVPHDKVGYVCSPTFNSVAESIENIWNNGNLERFCNNMECERKRFSWSEMCNKITEVYNKVK